jgi:hypothetical protein
MARLRKFDRHTIMNNTAILTAGNAIYSQKRAKKRGRTEELTFDPEQRKYSPSTVLVLTEVTT